MKPGRLTTQGELRRKEIEEALFALRTSVDLQDEAILRIRQAMQQVNKTTPVLEPGLERLLKSQSKLHRVKSFIEWLWYQGQAGRFEE
jgi:hypothetical protein